jgi:hypothetical protein
MALLALALVPIPDVVHHEEALLAHMGNVAGGNWLSWIISVDAALVLSGAVLTSFVGVAGLVRRMTLDRCLPQFLLKRNRRGSSHRIIVGFFLLCVSILLITKGRLEALAGVYTISFLSVMILFALGNVLLKVKRSRLPRPVRANWPMLSLAIVATLIGLIGNVIMHPAYFAVFLEYFIPTLLLVGVMLGRIGLLKISLFVVRAISEAAGRLTAQISLRIREKINEVNSQQMVFFTRGDNLANLNEAMLYVRRNEHTNRIKVVTVVSDKANVPPRLETDLQFLDEAYPDIDIEFVALEGTFGPELIEELSQRWSVPTNFMFIGSPGDHFLYGLAELGGVRLII